MTDIIDLVLHDHHSVEQLFDKLVPPPAPTSSQSCSRR